MLTAIRVTCEYLYNHIDKNIVIRIDYNLSSIQAVTALNIKNRTIGAVITPLKLGDLNKINLCWIADDADFLDNEAQLATLS